jgi:hypothetical protein
VQNTEIDAAVDTEVFNECKINENFIGTDPWELEFEEDEKEDVERLESERASRVEIRKAELEERKRVREEKKLQNDRLMYIGIAVFILIIMFLIIK